MKYAVSFDHLLWEEAEDEAEAIEMMREELGQMDADDLRKYDFSVMDAVSEEEW